MSTATREKAKARPAGPGSGYMALVQAHPLREIRSDEELAEAIAVLDGLIDRSGSLAPDEVEYQLALAILIGWYERDHIPEPEATPAAALRYFLDKAGVTQAKLAADTGLSESTVSEILAGKRGVSAKNRKRLAEYFGTEPGMFA